MAKNIIILGMARSGTSLTASIFASQQYYVDDDENITPKNHNNPKGFWESLRLTRLNENLLRASGFGHDNTWRYDAISPDQIAALQALPASDEQRAFVAEFEQRAPWVWKDLRLSYTLGTWWPLLDHLNTVVLLVRRDPVAIYNSFVRVGWRGDTTAERDALFERTRQHIENAKRLIDENAIPYIEIDYAEYQSAPDAVAKRINEAVGLSLGPEDIGYEPDLNHDNVLGKLSGRIDHVVNMLPAPLFKLARRMTPASLLRRLYPERYE